MLAGTWGWQGAGLEHGPLETGIKAALSHSLAQETSRSSSLVEGLVPQSEPCEGLSASIMSVVGGSSLLWGMLPPL